MAAAVRACIGLGANLGDAVGALRAALGALGALPLTRLAGVSPLYRSAPIDSSGPDYFNAVAVVETGLAPIELLDALQAIELAHGRKRPYRNAPRTLDLDVLLYGELQVDTPRLTLPHPRLHERAFVLAPLADLAPDLVMPGRGRVDDALRHVADQRIERCTERLDAADAPGSPR